MFFLETEYLAQMLFLVLNFFIYIVIAKKTYQSVRYEIFMKNNTDGTYKIITFNCVMNQHFIYGHFIYAHFFHIFLR